LPVDRDTIRQLIERMLETNAAQLGGVVLVGLTAVFFGYKLLRAYVVMAGIVSGAWLAFFLPVPIEGYFKMAFVVLAALACGVLSWFFYKALVFLFAGLMGAALAYTLAISTSTAAWPVYLACGLGFATMGILASVLLKPVTTAMMSLIGALITAEALLILISQMNPSFRGAFMNIDGRIMLGTLLFSVILACSGCAYQLAPERKKKKEEDD